MTGEAASFPPPAEGFEGETLAEVLARSGSHTDRPYGRIGPEGLPP